MAKPYDSGVRVLIEQYLPDWLALAQRKPQGPVRVIDSDLSTITAEADKLIYVEDPQPWILHLEPQANWDGALEKRVSWYNGIVSYKHDCLVHSVIVLLRREADSPRLTGEYVQQFVGEPPYRYFRYQVVRVWQMSADASASGGWGLFPLAPLCDDARPRLAELLERMAARLQKEVADLPKIAMLWQTAAILADMRYDQDEILPLMQKVMTMVKLEEFPSYAKGEARGEVKGRRETIIALAGKVLGSPDAGTLASLESINDLDRLRRMTDRLLDVDSWQELLAEDANQNPKPE